MKRALGAVLAGLALLAAGCASIPPNPSPQPLGPHAPQASAEVAKPKADLDPPDVVRDFIQATANPFNEYVEAKQYLTDDVRKGWKVNNGLDILDAQSLL